ncbi:lipid-A-disaccharide synthase [soil metagenome]
MKYYIIAGEASGDLHGANLIRELKKQDNQAEFRCWGGDLMKDQGAVLVKHYRELAFMGFLEVVMNLKTIFNNLKLCKSDIENSKPDVLILIDYPGFNMRIAEWAHLKGIKIVYYISPQIWAWKQSRVHKIKRDVDQMLVILPFEKDFYARFDMEVEFVGHPLLDALAQDQQDGNNWKREHHLDEREIIALLPGSRKQEINTMLPLMLEASSSFSEYQFVIAGAPSQPESYYRAITGDRKISIISGQTYQLLKNSKAALVTSGTATLETALIGIPEVVCYKGNFLSYQIARQLVKVKFISLVNLVMDREVVKELIQEKLNKKELEAELKKLLTPEYRASMLKDFAELRTLLGGIGASEKAATLIFQMLNQ